MNDKSTHSESSLNNISQAEIYRATKNVIHNDLGITKEYIVEVVEDTVKKEIDKLMGDDCFIRGLVEKQVLWNIGKKNSKNWHIVNDCSNWISEEINKTILEEVKNRLVIELKDDYDGRVLPTKVVQDTTSGHYIVNHKVGEE